MSRLPPEEPLTPPLPAQVELPSGAGAQSLTSGRVLARNVGWSLIGQILPSVVALAATPFIVHGFGDARFGLLTLAWMVVGYFSLFDFGLGRAVTHAVSEALAASDTDRMADVFWTSLYLLSVLGIVGCAALAAAASWIVHSGIKTPTELQHEARTVFLILALSIPFVVLSTGFRGALEAAQAFAWTNAVRVPLGIMGFLIPVLTLHFSRSLVPAVWGLLALRVIVAGAMWLLCVRLLPAVRRVRSFSRQSASKLLHFGAWVTVSNVVSPIMVSVDRVVVGAMLSVAMVTYYATPFSAVSRLLIIPAAIGAVIFPALAAARTTDPARMLRIYRVATRAIVGAVFPVAFGILVFAPELLGVWLGVPFPERSSVVLRWITMGVMVNSVAYVPYALIQSMGRADITAKAHMVELPLYLIALWALIRMYGINGAAAAWALRVMLDCCILIVMAVRLSGVSFRSWALDYAAVPVLLGLGGAALLIPGLLPRGVLAIVSTAGFAAVAWRTWLPELMVLRQRRRPSTAMEQAPT